MNQRFWLGILFCLATLSMSFMSGFMNSYFMLALTVLEGAIGVAFVVVGLNDMKAAKAA